MRKKLIMLLFICLAIGLSYLENTYVVNLFSPDYPALIDRYHGGDIYSLTRPGFANTPSINPRTVSVLIYHLLFAGLNALFIYLIFRKKSYQLIHWSVFMGLTVVLSIAYFMYIKTSIAGFYGISLLIKDFLQSPVYAFLFLIIGLYYPRLTAT